MSERDLLWLDDVRYPPNSNWIWVKTAKEAIEILVNKPIRFASLDHDLAPDQYPWSATFEEQHVLDESGEAVTNFLEKQCLEEGNFTILPIQGIRVHSMNPFGAKVMVDCINKLYTAFYQKYPQTFSTYFQCTNTEEIPLLPWQLYGQPNGYFQNAAPSMREIYRKCKHSR